MKKLILLLFFVPFISFSQVEQTINLNTGVDASTNVYGLKYQGNGRYYYARRGTTDLSTLNIQERKVKKAIAEFANGRTYKIINTDRLKLRGGIPYVKITFDLYDENGNLVINKDDAKKKLIELKEYLDLGIISEEEFKNSSKQLKRILLDK